MKTIVKNTLLAAALLTIFPAQAVDVEIGVGETHYIKQTDGVWYQEAFPYWMDTKDQNLSIGVSWQPDNIRYRAEFLALGAHYVNSIATSDGTYNPWFVANCGTDCGLVSLIGRGSVSGIVLSASRPVYVPVYVEAGVYANVKKWQVTISKVDGGFLRELQREHQIDFGPVIGLGVRYQGVDIGLRYIYLDDSSEGDPITPMMTGAYTLSFKAFF